MEVKMHFVRFGDGVKRDEELAIILKWVVRKEINKNPPRNEEEDLEVYIYVDPPKCVEENHGQVTYLAKNVSFGKYAYQDPWYGNRQDKLRNKIMKELSDISEEWGVSLCVKIERDFPPYIWDTSRAPWPF